MPEMDVYKLDTFPSSKLLKLKTQHLQIYKNLTETSTSGYRDYIRRKFEQTIQC